jgi:hypothetical protein
MSYICSVRRTIRKREFQALIEGDPSFRIESQNEHGLVAEWFHDGEVTIFVLSQGTIDVTSPSEAAYDKMQELARRLDAALIGEEEQFIVPRAPAKRGIFAGRTTWIGWPIIVVTLTILLIFKW